MSITFSDGTKICETFAADSFVKAIEKTGVEEVRNLSIRVSGVLLIDSEQTKKQQKPLGNYYVMTRTSTEVKQKILQEIAEKLGFSLQVDIIEPDSNKSTAIRYSS